MAGKPKLGADKRVGSGSSVSAKILAEFTETVAKQKELAGIGERLQKTLVEDGDFSEAAIRRALFGDASL